MQSKRRILLAALAVSVGGGLSVGAGTAHADDVLPGLTCDEQFLSTNCTNTTNTDYTVLQTRECAGGSYSTSYNGGTADNPAMYYTTHTVDPTVEYVRVFVPANNTGSGPRSSCELETERFYYSVEPPVPGPPPPPS
ncbi:Uncoordinated protein 34, isoform a [Mycolicibacterium rhodesiae JS60]|nr:Uncoordinated protein 34, isoform a [Mycolicibacterium rhodesiae JS60]